LKSEIKPSSHVAKYPVVKVRPKKRKKNGNKMDIFLVNTKKRKAKKTKKAKKDIKISMSIQLF
jgi:hypothetical protein